MHERFSAAHDWVRERGCDQRGSPPPTRTGACLRDRYSPSRFQERSVMIRKRILLHHRRGDELVAAVCWTVALALLFAEGGGDDGRRLPL